MGYRLEAVIALTEQLKSRVGQRHAHLVLLEQGFCLIPVVRNLYDEVNMFAEPEVPDGFVLLSAGLLVWLEKLSLGGTVAYVEADFHGGYGDQSACIYENGVCVLKPFVTSDWDDQRKEYKKIQLVDYAINIALRRLGVLVSAGLVDEFDSLGLGRERDTKDWLKQ